MKLATHSGRLVDPWNMRAEDIALVDIAQGLSNLCRFAGQIGQFYSVAQHSVMVADLLLFWGHSKETALLGLLHDASEAYLVDVPTMVKRHLKDYMAAEARLQRLVVQKLWTKTGNPGAKRAKAVKDADLAALERELGAFFPQNDRERRFPVIPEWSPTQARREFLALYQELRRGL